MKRNSTVSYLILILLIGTSTATLGVNYDETMDGDLSDDRDNPTILFLDSGDNMVSGTMGPIPGDVDFLTVNVAAGFQLDALFLDAFSGDADDVLSFLGMQMGTSWTEGIGGAIDPANLIGWSHFSRVQVGTDILDDIGNGEDAEGFTPPLPSGDYTMLLQEIGDPLSYTLNFAVSPVSVAVPEHASTLPLLAMSMIAMTCIGMRRQIKNSSAR